MPHLCHIVFPHHSPPNQLHFSAPRPRERLSHQTEVQDRSLPYRLARHSDSQDPSLLGVRCMNGFIALSGFGPMAVIGVVITEFDRRVA